MLTHLERAARRPRPGRPCRAPCTRGPWTTPTRCSTAPGGSAPDGDRAVGACGALRGPRRGRRAGRDLNEAAARRPRRAAVRLSQPRLRVRPGRRASRGSRTARRGRAGRGRHLLGGGRLPGPGAVPARARLGDRVRYRHVKDGPVTRGTTRSPRSAPDSARRGDPRRRAGCRVARGRARPARSDMLTAVRDEHRVAHRARPGDRDARSMTRQLATGRDPLGVAVLDRRQHQQPVPAQPDRLSRPGGADLRRPRRGPAKAQAGRLRRPAAQ